MAVLQVSDDGNGISEEYADMTAEQLFDRIEKGLYVDEAVADGLFRSDKKAEYLERAMYICPHCGLSEFESNRDIISCKQCGQTIRYLPTKELVGVNQPFPFQFVTEWYDYQCDFINNWDPRPYQDEPLYRDTARLSQVLLYKRKQLLRAQAAFALYGDRVVIDEQGSDPLVFPFEEATAVTVLGRNKLNIYHNKMVYQFKGSKRFNALKYVNLYYRYKNIVRGDSDGKFLGL